MRNACFNFKFTDADPLSSFNDIIEKNHLKIKNYIKENIIGINIEDEEIKTSLENIFDEENTISPNYLFYSDISLLNNSINKGGIYEYFKPKDTTNKEEDNNDWVII